MLKLTRICSKVVGAQFPQHPFRPNWLSVRSKKSASEKKKKTKSAEEKEKPPLYPPAPTKNPLPDFCTRVRPECGECARFRYMNPECRVAVITEGISGLGYDIASELLCNEAYRVILTGSNPEMGTAVLEEVRKKHEEERCCYMKLDPKNEDEVKSVLTEVADRFGGLDILVNNAKAINETFWETEVAFNLNSVILGTFAGMELMKRPKNHPGGLILNIASTLSFDLNPCLPVFTGTQYAIAGFTKSYGDKKNFAGSGVRVVGLCPGPLNASHLTCTQGLDLCFANPSTIGKAVIHLIQYAPTGSLWVHEDSLYRLKLPERNAFQKKITYV